MVRSSFTADASIAAPALLCGTVRDKGRSDGRWAVPAPHASVAGELVQKRPVTCTAIVRGPIDDPVIGIACPACDRRRKRHRAAGLKDPLVGQVAANQRHFPAIVDLSQGDAGAKLRIAALIGPRVEIRRRDIGGGKVGVDVERQLEVAADRRPVIDVEITRPFRTQRVTLAAIVAEATRSRRLQIIALAVGEVGEFEIEIGDRAADGQAFGERRAKIGFDPLRPRRRRIADVEVERPVEDVDLQILVFGAIEGQVESDVAGPCISAPLRNCRRFRPGIRTRRAWRPWSTSAKNCDRMSKPPALVPRA